MLAGFSPAGRCRDRFSISPTEGPSRFYVNSREEGVRVHIQIESSDGELKVWRNPGIELAQNYGIPDREVARILRIMERQRGEIRECWSQHRRR